MPDSASSAHSDRNRCTAGSEWMPEETLGAGPRWSGREIWRRRWNSARRRGASGMTNDAGEGRSVERRGRRATSGRRRKKRKSAKKRGSDKRLVGGSFKTDSCCNS